MTREEEIENKAIEKSAEYRFGQLYSYNNDVYSGFIQGAQWADKNPKCPWISVKDDLPCNHEEMIINTESLNPITKKVLVYNKNKEIRVTWMLYRKDKGWVWDITAYSQPLFYMFIPEPPKE